MRPKTDLGSQYLRRHHDVVVSEGPVHRASVRDQMLIDRMLIDDAITLEQHQAAEYILAQAVMAGLFARPTPDGRSSKAQSIGGATPGDMLLRYGRTMALIRRRYGIEAERLVSDVVCRDRDIRGSESQMDVLRLSLSLIADMRMAGGRNPLRHIRRK